MGTLLQVTIIKKTALFYRVIILQYGDGMKQSRKPYSCTAFISCVCVTKWVELLYSPHRTIAACNSRKI